MSERYVFTFWVLNNPLNCIPALQGHTGTREKSSKVIQGKEERASGHISSTRNQWGEQTVTLKGHARVPREDSVEWIIFLFFYLPGIGRHPPGHHPLQVAAQADALHSDDGLLGEDGAAEGGGTWLLTAMRWQHLIGLLNSHYVPGRIGATKWQTGNKPQLLPVPPF